MFDASEILLLKSHTKFPVEISGFVLTPAPVLRDSLLLALLLFIASGSKICFVVKINSKSPCACSSTTRDREGQNDWIAVISPNSWSSRESSTAMSDSNGLIGHQNPNPLNLPNKDQQKWSQVTPEFSLNRYCAKLHQKEMCWSAPKQLSWNYNLNKATYHHSVNQIKLTFLK